MNQCSNASDVTKSINILDAIMILADSNKKLDPSTITKCFIRCGFPIRDDENENCVEIVDEINEIENLINSIYGTQMYSAKNYVDLDNEVNTEIDTLDLNEILNLHNENYEEESDIETLESTPDPKSPPTLRDAVNAVELIKEYSLNIGNNDMYGLVEKLNLQLAQSLTIKKKTKQSTLDKFFLY